MSSYILLEMSLRNIVKEHPNVSFVEFVYFVNSNIESEVTWRNINMQNKVPNWKFYQENFFICYELSLADEAAA